MRLVAIDTETSVEMLPAHATMVCMSYATPGAVAGVFGHQHIYTPLKGLLADKNTILIGHNMAFDMAQLASTYPDLLESVFQAYADNRVKCTMIRSWLHALAQGLEEYEPKPSHSLVSVYERYVGGVSEERLAQKHAEDAWRFRYIELYDTPVKEWPEAASKYAIEDAEATLAVYLAQCEVQIHETLEEGEYPSEELLAASHFAATYTSMHNGFHRDFDALVALEQVTAGHVERIHALMVEKGLARYQKKKGVSVLVRDMKAWREAITIAYEGNPPRNKPTEKMLEKDPNAEGSIKTDAKTILRTGDQVLIEAGGEGWLKVDSTYLPALRRTEYDVVHKGLVTRLTIHPDYKMSVNTGRMSVSGQAPLQQFPRDKGIRDVLIPATGHAVVMTDLASSESVCLAETQCRYLETPSCKLLDLLTAGIDIHCYTGFFIADKMQHGRFSSYEDLKASYEAGDKDAKKYRTMAKPVNHGGGGGLGPEAFRDFAASYSIFMTKAEAKIIIDAWKEALSDITQYFAWISRQQTFKEDYSLKTWTTGRIRSGMTYPSACNYGFQASAADGKRLSMFLLVREQLCKGHHTDDLEWVPGTPSGVYGSKLLLEMHDEFITECLPEQVAAVAERQEHLLKIGIKSFMSHAGHVVGADSVSAYRWTKKAKRVTDKAGNLIPWQE
jgi:hypothetical protein